LRLPVVGLRIPVLVSVVRWNLNAGTLIVCHGFVLLRLGGREKSFPRLWAGVTICVLAGPALGELEVSDVGLGVLGEGGSRVVLATLLVLSKAVLDQPLVKTCHRRMGLPQLERAASRVGVRVAGKRTSANARDRLPNVGSRPAEVASTPLAVDVRNLHAVNLAPSLNVVAPHVATAVA